MNLDKIVIVAVSNKDTINYLLIKIHLIYCPYGDCSSSYNQEKGYSNKIFGDFYTQIKYITINQNKTISSTTKNINCEFIFAQTAKKKELFWIYNDGIENGENI